MAPEVHHQHPVAWGEVLDLVSPVGDIAGEAVDKNQVIAPRAMALVVKRYPFDGGGGHGRA